MGEAARKAQVGQQQVRSIVQNAMGFAAEVIAQLVCDKCSFILGEPSGPPDCPRCGPVRDFLGFPSRNRIVSAG